MPGKLQPTLIKYPTKQFQPLIYCLSTNCCFHSFPGGKSKFFFPQTSLVQNATFRNLKLEISVVTHWDPCCDQQLKLYFEVVFLKLVVEFCVGKKKSHKMSIMGFVLSMIVLFVFFVKFWFLSFLQFLFRYIFFSIMLLLWIRHCLSQCVDGYFLFQF